MTTQLSFVEYVAEVTQLEGQLTYKKMFGEYALYLGGKVVAFACDNSLFIKASPETAAMTAGLPGRPPYPGAKDYPVADELLDEPDALRRLLLATERAMPEAKVKTAKPKAAKPAGITKAVSKEAAVKKTTAKKTVAKKTATVKPVAKKTVATKAAAKKTAAKKASRPSAAKRTPPKSR
jgi:TfoX/Sxy family transcriptional regulator of competence genes